MSEPVAKMTIDEAKKALVRAHADYMSLPCGADAPPKLYAQWLAARELRNEIYRQFGEQVLDWPRR